MPMGVGRLRRRVRVAVGFGGLYCASLAASAQHTNSGFAARAGAINLHAERRDCARNLSNRREPLLTSRILTTRSLLTRRMRAWLALVLPRWIHPRQGALCDNQASSPRACPLSDTHPFRSLDFFAGSGLVRIGLEPEFETVWANDNCSKKAEIYNANGPRRPLDLRSIEVVQGAELPDAELAWGSFPCQDLSLAGNLVGIRKGSRSGLFWEWIRVLDEMEIAGKRPPILVAENVVGFLVAHNGLHFKRAYEVLRERGYRVGAVVVDAKVFVPHSRPRAFVIAVSNGISLDGLTQNGPSAPFHTDGIIRVASVVRDPEWVWWSLPSPKAKPPKLSSLCQRNAPHESVEKTRQLKAMLSPLNKKKLADVIAKEKFFIGTGYRRMRPDEHGNKVQRLEIRFDGIAGCLRTPEGGSSRQVVLMVKGGEVKTRLLTVRECARLMGAPDGYRIPGSYNDGYRAMGDAVAVPVTRWVTINILAPLAGRYRSTRGQDERGTSPQTAA
jgi:DNA (cytosine-5)-methyltransferase 1